MGRPPKARLPISRAGSAKYERACWIPAHPSLWTKLAAVLGQEDLAPDFRSDVSEIVGRYLDDEPFSQNAPKIDTATAWLQEIGRAASEITTRCSHEEVAMAALGFISAYTGGGGGGAGVHARSVVNEFLAEAGHRSIQHFLELVKSIHREPYAVQDFMRHAAALSRACADAKEEIGSSEHARFDERGAWRNFIIRLWRLFEARGLKPSTDMSRVDIGERPPTLFVEFVGVLLEALPWELRGPLQRQRGDTDAALTQAIVVATKPIRG